MCNDLEIGKEYNFKTIVHYPNNNKSDESFFKVERTQLVEAISVTIEELQEEKKCSLKWQTIQRGYSVRVLELNANNQSAVFSNAKYYDESELTTLGKEIAKVKCTDGVAECPLKNGITIAVFIGDASGYKFCCKRKFTITPYIKRLPLSFEGENAKFSFSEELACNVESYKYIVSKGSQKIVERIVKRNSQSILSSFDLVRSTSCYGVMTVSYCFYYTDGTDSGGKTNEVRMPQRISKRISGKYNAKKSTLTLTIAFNSEYADSTQIPPLDIIYSGKQIARTESIEINGRPYKKEFDNVQIHEKFNEQLLYIKSTDESFKYDFV
jgi:hypothetical protein